MPDTEKKEKYYLSGKLRGRKEEEEETVGSQLHQSRQSTGKEKEKEEKIYILGSFEALMF